MILQKENSSKIAVTREDTFNHSYTVLVPSGIVVIRVSRCLYMRKDTLNTRVTLSAACRGHAEVMQISACLHSLFNSIA